MSRLQTTLDTLQGKGYRITMARKALVKVFLNSKSPLSTQDLNARLEKLDVHVNRTTIYREVEFLKKQKLIRELQFGDGKRRFEKWPDNHHHHLVCESCDSIECIELQGCLQAEEKRILKTNNFKILRHSLEFIGLCEKCQQ